MATYFQRDGVCADCKWWQEWRVVQPGWGQCEISHGYGEPPSDNQKAWASDNEGYHAVLMTAPDFGCNQYEEKGEEIS